MEKTTLLKLAETTHDLVADATSPEELKLLAALAVEVKAVLDYSDNQLHNVHPDLGLNLVEFAQLKRDGYKDQADEYGKEAMQAVEALAGSKE